MSIKKIPNICPGLINDVSKIAAFPFYVQSSLTNIYLVKQVAPSNLNKSGKMYLSFASFSALSHSVHTCVVIGNASNLVTFSLTRSDDVSE